MKEANRCLPPPGPCRSEISDRLFVVLVRLAKTIFCLMKSIVQTSTILPLLREVSGYISKNVKTTVIAILVSLMWHDIVLDQPCIQSKRNSNEREILVYLVFDCLINNRRNSLFSQNRLSLRVSQGILMKGKGNKGSFVTFATFPLLNFSAN